MAPTARRTPISRVRSVTVTNMMFMIPMPPTSSETEAMLARSSVNVRLVSCCAWRISSGLRRLKSSGAPARRWWRWRSRRTICSLAGRMASGEIAEHTMSSSQLVPLSLCSAVVKGMRIVSS